MPQTPAYKAEILYLACVRCSYSAALWVSCQRYFQLVISAYLVRTCAFSLPSIRVFGFSYNVSEELHAYFARFARIGKHLVIGRKHSYLHSVSLRAPKGFFTNDRSSGGVVNYPLKTGQCRKRRYEACWSPGTGSIDVSIRRNVTKNTFRYQVSAPSQPCREHSRSAC